MPILRSPLPARLLIGAAAAFVLASCNEDQTAKVEELSEQLELVRDDLAHQQSRSEEIREELAEAHTEVRELKSQLRTTDRALKNAENELERYRHKEEVALEAEAESETGKPDPAAAREAVAAAGNSTARISGDRDKGSGVLIAEGGKTWIYFPREIVEENTRLEITSGEGSALKRFGSFEVARGLPLARLELLEEGIEALAIAAGTGEIERSTPLLALDQDGGMIEGRTYGPGSDGGLRIDRKIEACPAGSPVFLGDSGGLIGMMLPRPSGEPTLWPSRFARERDTAELRRLDETIEWVQVPIGSFMKEAQLLAQTDRRSRLIHAIAATSVSAAGLAHGMLPGGMSAEEILEAEKSDPAVKALRELGPWLAENASRMSQVDVQKRIQSAYQRVAQVSQQQSREMTDTRFSAAHAAAAARSREWLEEANQALTKKIRSFE